MTEDSLKQLLLVSNEENSGLSKLEDLVQLSEDDSAQATFQCTSPKSLWNQSRDRFGYELPQYRHEILQVDDSTSKHQVEHKVTLLTVLANPSPLGESEVSSTTKHCYDALRANSHVGSHPDYDWIEMVTVGIAATKQRASQLAALDQIRLWKEATGVDLTLSPESWPLEAFADNEGEVPTLSSHSQEKSDDALEKLYSQSKTLLGLLRCSPIKYDFDFVQGTKKGNSYWTAEAETYWEGSYYFSTATDDQDMPLFLARSKKEAKKNALVALLEQNDDTALGRAVDSYRPILELGPNVAALRIPKWKEGIAEKLSASLDSWESTIDSSNKNSGNDKADDEELSKEQTFDDQIQENVFDITSDALWSQEQTKLQRYAKDHPQILDSIRKARENLPIASMRNELKEALQRSNIVLVQAGTGSGKSTQIPQFILEEALSSQKASTTRILVTQPRRIAAKSLAERVSYERLESPPKGKGIKSNNKRSKDRSVGYSVRFDSMKPRREGGSIEYVTTGILLKRILHGSKGLEDVSHILIDEVHERDVDTDLLLVLMRDLWTQGQHQMQQGLQPKIPKVVLLSATLDTSALTEYFATASMDGKKSIPILSLPTKPLHPVETLYLDDILENESNNDVKYSSKLKELTISLLQSNDLLLKQELKSLEESHDDKADERTEILKNALSLRVQAQLIHSEDDKEMNPLTPKEFRSSMIDLVAELALHLSSNEITENKNKGSVLCFLPGMSEIKECMHRIEETCPKHLKGKLKILPLHSDIPHREQSRVFKPSKAGTIKIILATNIAESSITIDDVLAVIDSGLVKESSFEATSATTSLETVMTSKESAIQRLGRVGRVAPGVCYRLYSKGDFEAMEDKTAPEIQKACLSRTCLQISSLLEGNNCNGFDTIEEFLDNVLDAPSAESVQVALSELISLGAISDKSHRRTVLGECLVRLPLDPSIGKMLIVGAALNCLDPLLTAASWFGENQIVFSNASLNDTRKSHRFFSKTSDTEGIIQAYDQFWQVQSNEGWKTARKGAREQRINPSAMTSMRAVRRQLLDELCRAGLVDPGDVERGELRLGATINENRDCKLLVSALWCTAVPQNLAARNKMDGFGVLTTSSDESARFHPSSVLFQRRPPTNESAENDVIHSEWYSFRRKVQTDNVFLRGCSSVLPEQILLFGGSHLDTTTKAMVPASLTDIKGILDEWIIIEGNSQQIVHLLIRARKAIQTILEHKLLSLSSGSNKTLQDENDGSIVQSIRMFLGELENGRIPEPEPRAPSNDFLDYFLEDEETE